MIKAHHSPEAQTADIRQLYYFNAGFLRQRQVRRILELTGYQLRLGRRRAVRADDLIAVWGHSPYAKRGEAVAKRVGAGLIRIEDAFLRSLHPGRDGEPPLGLVIDTRGAHFNSNAPSDLEHLLKTHPLDDTALMDRARGCIARLQEAHLSKYSAFDPQAPCPDPGYVLVIDQTHGDASVRLGGADANSFREMLYYAQEDNPGARIVIKTHPETTAGHRKGYFTAADQTDRIQLFTDPVSPWSLLEGAIAVYTVSSQLGFEAIYAGHKPITFGQPFYAGWGLSDDRHPVPLTRRNRNLSRAQLFTGAMILYPTWYDPCADRLCSLEQAISLLEARTRGWREDRQGWDAYGMRLWKRRPLQKIFGQFKRVKFVKKPGRKPARVPSRPAMVWASKSDMAPPNATRIEDGFLRSRGLGAELIPPLSLVCDDLGIYYDPCHESRLEKCITRRANLRPDQARRAEALMARLTKLGLSKYNLGGPLPDLPDGRRILVVGQVEDDASIRLGAGDISTNLGLLKRARADNPEAVILYKPHPDVEAGLRAGHIPRETLTNLADLVLEHCDPAQLLAQVDDLWTMTSLMGFEALIRGVHVTCTGAPFYAGWGLTHDIGAPPKRRTARPSLGGLVHATLIDYPRYYDPVTGTACPVETIIERLATSHVPHPGAANRALAKLQGIFASYAGLWR